MMRPFVLGAILFGACSSGSSRSLWSEGAPLAVAERARDFESYSLRRVGLLPFSGQAMSIPRAAELQAAFATELARVAPYEIVMLDASDVLEVIRSDPHRRGAYQPGTIIELARRFRLDGLLVGTVTQLRTYTPQILGLELDLVASDTGRSIWYSSLNLDAGDERVKRSIDVWCNNEREGSLAPESSELVLLSPSRFARFAAHEVSRVF